MNKNAVSTNKNYEGFLEGFAKMTGMSSIGFYVLPSALKRENLTRLSGPPYKEGCVGGAMAGSVAGGLALGSQIASYFMPEFQAHGYEALEPLAWSNGISLAFEAGESIYKNFKGGNSSDSDASSDESSLEKKAS